MRGALGVAFRVGSVVGGKGHGCTLPLSGQEYQPEQGPPDEAGHPSRAGTEPDPDRITRHLPRLLADLFRLSSAHAAFFPNRSACASASITAKSRFACSAASQRATKSMTLVSAGNRPPCISMTTASSFGIPCSISEA